MYRFTRFLFGLPSERKRLKKKIHKLVWQRNRLAQRLGLRARRRRR
jgi:hypothetical protein